MRIAVSSTGRGPESEIDPRFGRCAYFIIIDRDSMDYQVHNNENMALGRSAGIRLHSLLRQRVKDVVITGNCGTNAMQTLSAAGIKVITGQQGNVKDIIERYRKGELSPASAPNVYARFGMGWWYGQRHGYGNGGGTDVDTCSQVQTLKGEIKATKKGINEILRRLVERLEK